MSIVYSERTVYCRFEIYRCQKLYSFRFETESILTSRIKKQRFPFVILTANNTATKNILCYLFLYRIKTQMCFPLGFIKLYQII
jgi:hypothetical protein